MNINLNMDLDIDDNINLYNRYYQYKNKINIKD